MRNPLLSLAWKVLGRHELKIDQEKCVRCGKCAKTCHHNAVIKTPEKDYMIRSESCMRCYHCKENCPKGAIIENGK